MPIKSYCANKTSYLDYIKTRLKCLCAYYTIRTRVIALGWRSFAYREESTIKGMQRMFTGTFQKSMCSEMASELRYALDCGNGTKKSAKKTLCSRERQESNLSIVSEEGRYPVCNKYRHFVGKAPLTWSYEAESSSKGEEQGARD